MGGETGICFLFRLVYVIFQNTQKIRERDLFTFIAIGVTSLSFSNCTPRASFLYIPFENPNDVKPVQ